MEIKLTDVEAEQFINAHSNGYQFLPQIVGDILNKELTRMKDIKRQFQDDIEAGAKAEECPVSSIDIEDLEKFLDSKTVLPF